METAKNQLIKKILVFSAHPDDEIGGTGGFLLKMKSLGAKIKLVLCIDPGQTRLNLSESAERNIRLREFRKVAGLLGADQSFLKFPRYFIIDLKKIIFPLVKEIRFFKPNIILSPSIEDYHFEHRKVAEAIKEAIWIASRSACPKLGKPFKIDELRQYETDRPLAEIDLLEDITEFIDQKQKLLRIYNSQLKRKDLIRAITGLNNFRGIMYKCGQYAEAFKVIKFFYG